MKPKIVAIIAGVGVVVAVLLVLAGVKFLQIHKMMTMKWPAPVETIASATASEEKWRDTLTAVGTIDAENGINIMAEIAGPVREIEFDSGATVNKGDLLVKLDTSSEEAQLRAAEAQAKLSQLNAERMQRLRADNTVSQSELDTAEATMKQDAANADAIRAVIDKKNIHAPFSGKLGIWLVSIGQFVDIGKPLVSLQSLSPVFADFSLPQQDVAKLQPGLVVHVTTDAYPDKQFTGELQAVNPNLDATTRSVLVRAKFKNEEQFLRPGMFVRVQVELPDETQVLAIPSTAILSAPYGDSVFLIKTAAEAGMTNMPATNLVVQQKFIRTGRTHGDFISVESGLSAGDRVVSAGLFKLHNGDSVQINNEDTPKPSLNPNPPNS